MPPFSNEAPFPCISTRITTHSISTSIIPSPRIIPSPPPPLSISPPIHFLSIFHHNHSLSSLLSPRFRSKQTIIPTNRYAMKWIGCPNLIFPFIGAPLSYSGEWDASTTVMLHGIRSKTTHTTDLVGVVKDQSSSPFILSPCTRWLLVLTVVRRDWLAHQNNGFKEHNER